MVLPLCLYDLTTRVYACAKKSHRKSNTWGMAHCAQGNNTLNTHRENGRAWHIKLIVCACENVCVLLCICVLCVSTCWLRPHYECVCCMLLTAMWCDHEVVRELSIVLQTELEGQDNNRLGWRGSPHLKPHTVHQLVTGWLISNTW